MKKFTKAVILVVVFVLATYSFASAIDYKEIKKLYVNNAALLVEVTECNIEKLDMEKALLDSYLSTLDYVKKSTESKKITSDAERTITSAKRRLGDVSRLKKEKLETLKQAKKVLRDANSLPE